MKKAINQLMFVASILIITNCAPARFVKTLEKNKSAASFSFGGPVIKFAGAAVPVPFTSLAYGYGLTEKSTVFGSIHTTSLLFGNLQTDLGSTFSLFKKENRFGITTTPALQMAWAMGQKQTFRMWPSLDLNAYFHFKERKSYLYTGVNGWFELSKTRAHGETQMQKIIPNCHLGYTFVKTKWQHQFELKYLALGIPNLPNIVEYISTGNQGSFGIYYSLIRSF